MTGSLFFVCGSLNVLVNKSVMTGSLEKSVVLIIRDERIDSRCVRVRYLRENLGCIRFYFNIFDALNLQPKWSLYAPVMKI